MHLTVTAFTIKRALWRLAGATAIRASGSYGDVVGSVDDRAVLERYAETGTWLPAEIRLLTDFFARNGGGTYLDIGANIGLTTIPIARNPAVTCFAFEPEPINFAHLQENVRSHCRTGNVHLFQLALLDSTGMLELRMSPVNKGDHRIRVGRESRLADDAAWPSIQVQTRRLDDIGIDPESVPPLAAKVVAQGSEVRILWGGQQTLSKAEVLVLEFYPYLLSRGGTDWTFFRSFLTRNFSQAALIAGGQPTDLDWQSLPEMVEGLQVLVQTAAPRADLYFHLIVRK
jgi:FkbM family methyltransferase